MTEQEIEQEIEKHKCPEWAIVIVFKAVDHNFIDFSEIQKAVKILNKYNSEDELFNADNQEILEYMLVLASQI
jgi:RNase P protein component